MTESFDRETWKARVAEWWQETGRDLPHAMARLGVKTSYGLLAASVFLPLLEVYAPDNPAPAISTLIGIVGGVGGNLIANVLQGAYDKANAPRKIDQEIAEDPEIRAAYQAMINELDAVARAQETLGEQWDDFRTDLTTELEKMGGGLHIETGGGAVILGDVRLDHSELVMGDKNVTVYQTLPEPDFTAQRQAYLRHVLKEMSQVPLLGIRAVSDDADQVQHPPLAQVYVALNTTHKRLDPSEGEPDD